MLSDLPVFRPFLKDFRFHFRFVPSDNACWLQIQGKRTYGNHENYKIKRLGCGWSYLDFCDFWPFSEELVRLRIAGEEGKQIPSSNIQTPEKADDRRRQYPNAGQTPAAMNPLVSKLGFGYICS